MYRPSRVIPVLGFEIYFITLNGAGLRRGGVRTSAYNESRELRHYNLLT